jgi:hypothetical protein
MRKLKVFWDFEKEEQYLDEMAAQGHILKNYSSLGVYHFIDGQPQQLNYKIDYRTFSTRAEFENYVALFEDAGWRHVCGTKWNGSQYFLPASEQAGTDIFSDRASAAERYKSLYEMCITSIAIFVCYLVTSFLNLHGHLAQLGFLTPGLWERSGAAFWEGFFFELPFVILRIGFPVFFIVMSVLYGYWGVRAHQAYRAQTKEEAK